MLIPHQKENSMFVSKWMPTAVLVLTAGAWSETASADLSAASQERALASLSHRAAPSLPVLRRAAASTADSVAAALSTALCDSSCESSTTSELSNEIRVDGKRWTLRVADEGSVVSYSNREVAARAHDQGQDAKVSSSTLDGWARAFIRDRLGGMVTIGPNETLETVGTDQRIEGGQSASGGPVTTKVVANRIAL